MCKGFNTVYHILSIVINFSLTNPYESCSTSVQVCQLLSADIHLFVLVRSLFYSSNRPPWYSIFFLYFLFGCTHSSVQFLFLLPCHTTSICCLVRIVYSCMASLSYATLLEVFVWTVLGWFL